MKVLTESLTGVGIEELVLEQCSNRRNFQDFPKVWYTPPGYRWRRKSDRNQGRHMSFHIEVDRTSRLPIHRQLRRKLTKAIASREITPGQYLPSTRRLATSAGVNRLTALKALQAMQRAGIISARPGRGYFVVPREPGRMPLPDDGQDLIGMPAKIRPKFDAAYSETVDSASYIPLSFAAGYPDASLLPLKQLRQLFVRWTGKFTGEDFEYQAPIPGGSRHGFQRQSAYHGTATSRLGES